MRPSVIFYNYWTIISVICIETVVKILWKKRLNLPLGSVIFVNIFQISSDIIMKTGNISTVLRTHHSSPYLHGSSEVQNSHTIFGGQ